MHARDELGIDTEGLSNPLQAAWASALSFSIGASVPLLTISLMPSAARVVAAIVITLVSLTALGVAGAVIGGAPRVRAALRVTVWGALAMGITMAIGALVGTAV